MDTNNTPATRADIAEAVQQLREYIDERSRDLQTEILRGFADYNNSANIRFRKLEADTSNIDNSTTQRLGELERQMADFKFRLIALETRR
ncbi:MAG: hypothetical protein JOY62_01355 [Acidobacteriaceae bacterium]|nr:hypothetical protein [Acidobacteriaceae bacterium]MBV9778593.1 hypothetical protein [Acidobacteriaceae bacterium]